MKINVDRAGGGTRFVMELEPGSTKGATLGKNLYDADGNILDLAAYIRTVIAATEPSGGLQQTSWKLLLDIPPRVKAIAASSGVGIYVITSNTSGVTREIEGTPGRIVVSSGDGVASNPVIDIDPSFNLGGVLPVVTGEVPPVFVYFDDGSLLYAPASY